MLKCGFAKINVTPKLGIPLAGYLNPRPSEGIHDDLYIRVTLLQTGTQISGLVTYDLCFVPLPLTERIRQALLAAGIPFARQLVYNSIHTHTAPYPSSLFGDNSDPAYLQLLVDQTITAVRAAQADLAETSVSAGIRSANDLAFNRRFWLKNGRVATNPGKLNPDIVKSEGPVDNDITVIAFQRGDEIVALWVNLVNHTDTIGDNLVSADWPGRMEAEISAQLGHPIIVNTLIGASGNINHFDVTWNSQQYSYAECCRIGQHYGQEITAMLTTLEPLTIDTISVATAPFHYTSAVVTPEQKAAAEAILARPVEAKQGNMTSEDIVKGTGAVARFFAEQLVGASADSGKALTTELVCVKLGDRLAISTLPCEPFTEIGLQIKTASPFAYTLIASLGQDRIGYVCLPENYPRGGYEILPISGAAPGTQTAPPMTAAAINLLCS